MEVSLPLAEVLRDVNLTKHFWPDLAQKIVPQINKRQKIVERMMPFLDLLALSQPISPEIRSDFYTGVSELLDTPEYARLVLFLPFESFPDISDRSPEAEQFRANYLSAWQDLLDVHDIRAIFTDGNIDTANGAVPLRVVKAAHLIPWLVRSGMLESSDVVRLIEEEVDQVLLQSLFEVVPVMEAQGQLSNLEQQRIDRVAAHLPESITHSQGLGAGNYPRPETATLDLQDLTSPVSNHLPALADQLELCEALAARLSSDQTAGVVLLGGPKLRGYGDAVELDVVTTGPDSGIPDSHALPLADFHTDPAAGADHVFLDLLIGEANNIENLVREVAPLCFTESDFQVRAWATEKLEQSLIEYDLLHHGYPENFPSEHLGCVRATSIDGDSPFYETTFRVLATMLYIENIFIPKLS